MACRRGRSKTGRLHDSRVAPAVQDDAGDVAAGIKAERREHRRHARRIKRSKSA
jgi:hypothetical protein